MINKFGGMTALIIPCIQSYSSSFSSHAIYLSQATVTPRPTTDPTATTLIVTYVAIETTAEQLQQQQMTLRLQKLQK